MPDQNELMGYQMARSDKWTAAYPCQQWLAVVVLALLLMPAATASDYSDYSESREPCRDFAAQRKPHFGDFHVHTRYSLDASTQGTRTTPDQSYRFAKGEAIGIQPWDDQGQAARRLQLERPLDFAMVSDHAELIGEVYMCNTPGVDGHDSLYCRFYRVLPRGAYYLFNYMASMRASHLGLCGEDGALCRSAALAPWSEMREAAEQHYDRNETCSFTTFVGYEWTGLEAASGGNLHRNVIYRNDQVPELPYSYIDGPDAELLWRSLESDCNQAQGGCEALSIPHNSNLSAGAMFRRAPADGEPVSAELAALRVKIEPLMEIMQHKGASECFYNAGQVEDELCAFEQLPVDNIAGYPRAPKPDTGFARQVLSAGLQVQRAVGVNPFKLGMIASTDTHLGAPGAATENRFLGHGGAGVPALEEVPPGLPDKPEYNPGGLAVIWAEENSRDALFNGLQRRETYGTSGPRIVSRFFAGWDYPENLCDNPERVGRAYADGVPMGGDLPPSPAAGGAPIFALFAQQDPGGDGFSGMPLQRIQLVKGWVDAQGRAQERVYDVAGGDNEAAVDSRSCVTRGAGHASLCAVWRDPEFDSKQSAWYYSRVLENPSCRWSQRLCVAAAVNCAEPATIGEGYEACCAPEHRPIIQERAWSSPIWYTPAG